MFKIPTLNELAAQTQTEIDYAIPGAQSRLRGGMLNVFSRVIAAIGFGLYGYIQYCYRQMMVDTAENAMLDRHGRIWGILRRPAAFAIGGVTANGAANTQIPGGTIIQTVNGLQYITNNDATIAANGMVKINVTAVLSGVSSNLDAGLALSLVSPIIGVTGFIVAEGGIIGGAATENNDDYRARIMDRIQNPPQNGTEKDYVKWCLGVSGVTNAWVRYQFDLDGHKRVLVYFVNTGSAIPNAAKIAEVTTAINQFRPVTADVTVLAPIPVIITPRIRLSSQNPSLRTAIKDGWKNLVLTLAAPGDGAAAGTISLARLTEAVTGAASGVAIQVVAPNADIIPNFGEIIQSAEIVFVD